MNLLKRLKYLWMGSMKIVFLRGMKQERSIPVKKNRKIAIEDDSDQKVYNMHNYINSESEKICKNIWWKNANQKQLNVISFGWSVFDGNLNSREETKSIETRESKEVWFLNNANWLICAAELTAKVSL